MCRKTEHDRHGWTVLKYVSPSSVHRGDVVVFALVQQRIKAGAAAAVAVTAHVSLVGCVKG
jgi:hypothetical protein